jgi:fatty acid desaturase
VTAQVSGAPVVRRRSRTVEWPSITLCVGIYGGFAALTWFHQHLPALAVAVLGAVLLAWHSSMQHEFIHGHPTSWRRLNRFLGFVPLSLWLPFESYRMSHLVHHCDDSLTDPFDDPETFYWAAEDWQALGPVGRLVVRAHTTLAGRMVIGPAWNILRYLLGEARALRAGDRVRRRIWAWHGLGVAAVLFWVVGVCGIDPVFYLLGMVYPGTALLLIRSFAEHRAREGIFERTAIVENSWFFGPLYLFNNLHAAHHERPLIPWYELPGWYKANRTRLLAENGGLVYDGYGDVARRFLFTPHDVNVHPFVKDREAGESEAAKG